MKESPNHVTRGFGVRKAASCITLRTIRHGACRSRLRPRHAPARAKTEAGRLNPA